MYHFFYFFLLTKKISMMAKFGPIPNFLDQNFPTEKSCPPNLKEWKWQPCQSGACQSWTDGGEWKLSHLWCCHVMIDSPALYNRANW